MPKVGGTRIALAFVNAVDAREAKGLPIFGDYNPDTDKRSMSIETEEEVEDGGVYQRFFRKKYKRNKDMVKNSEYVTYHLYKAWCYLQEQKRMETEIISNHGI